MLHSTAARRADNDTTTRTPSARKSSRGMRPGLAKTCAPETPSEAAIRELREWFARHADTGSSELGGHSRKGDEAKPSRSYLREAHAVYLARSVVEHLLSAIDLERQMAEKLGGGWPKASWSPARIGSVFHGRDTQVHLPATMTFTFGDTHDVPRKLPNIGKGPQRWRVLANVCRDFDEATFTGSGVFGEDHDARDQAADEIMALGRWPKPTEVYAAVNRARAPARKRIGKAAKGAKRGQPRENARA